jgi:dissimilatory sulfite reductase (desulfoviridin) alpha/beta subunit
MKKKLNQKRDKPIKPPAEIIKAVKLIEDWAKKQTDRDDWAIGEISCRKGFERLLRDVKNERFKRFDF